MAVKIGLESISSTMRPQINISGICSFNAQTAKPYMIKEPRFPKYIFQVYFQSVSDFSFWSLYSLYDHEIDKNTCLSKVEQQILMSKSSQGVSPTFGLDFII